MAPSLLEAMLVPEYKIKPYSGFAFVLFRSLMSQSTFFPVMLGQSHCFLGFLPLGPWRNRFAAIGKASKLLTDHVITG